MVENEREEGRALIFRHSKHTLLTLTCYAVALLLFITFLNNIFPSVIIIHSLFLALFPVIGITDAILLIDTRKTDDNQTTLGKAAVIFLIFCAFTGPWIFIGVNTISAGQLSLVTWMFSKMHLYLIVIISLLLAPIFNCISNVKRTNKRNMILILTTFFFLFVLPFINILEYDKEVRGFFGDFTIRGDDGGSNTQSEGASTEKNAGRLPF